MAKYAEAFSVRYHTEKVRVKHELKLHMDGKGEAKSQALI
jgi:hypothetical protein